MAILAAVFLPVVNPPTFELEENLTRSVVKRANGGGMNWDGRGDRAFSLGPMINQTIGLFGEGDIDIQLPKTQNIRDKDILIDSRPREIQLHVIDRGLGASFGCLRGRI